MEIKNKRRATVFILLTLVLDAMGIGLIVPIMPDLIISLDGGDISSAALWGGILLTTYSVMQFLAGPILGGLSDRYGRRPVLLVSLLAMTIDYIIMALAQSMWLIVLTRIVGGITGATQSTATAVMADISSEKNKTANFGLVGAAFGVGFILGPVVGGLLGEFGLRTPFYFAAALAFINLILGFFALPETLSPAYSRPFRWRRANPLGALKALYHFPGVAPILAMLFLYEFAFMVYPTIWAYFPKLQYGWSPGLVGISLMLVGLSMALVQGVFIRIFTLKFRETTLVFLGFSFELVCFLLLVVVTSGTIAMILTPALALGAVISPTLMSWMSRAVPDDQQGELQGLIASMRSVAAIFSPLVMSNLFGYFSRPDGVFLPGAPFIAAAALMFGSLLIFGRYRERITVFAN